MGDVTQSVFWALFSMKMRRYVTFALGLALLRLALDVPTRTAGLVAVALAVLYGLQLAIYLLRERPKPYVPEPYVEPLPCESVRGVGAQLVVKCDDIAGHEGPHRSVYVEWGDS
jgi:hypothetical protein